MSDTDVIIESLLRRIDELQQQLLAAIEQGQQKDKLIEEQAAIILQLQEWIARLEKNSSTSSKPPSSDITNPPDKPNSKKKKRKRGGQKGHKKHTRRKFTQEEIDETLVHELSDEEVERRGLIKLPQTESALQQVSLPKKLFYVTDHHVQLYVDKNGKEVKAAVTSTFNGTP